MAINNKSSIIYTIQVYDCRREVDLMSITRQLSCHYQVLSIVYTDIGYTGARVASTYINFEKGARKISIPSKAGSTPLPLYVPYRIIGVWEGMYAWITWRGEDIY